MKKIRFLSLKNIFLKSSTILKWIDSNSNPNHLIQKEKKKSKNPFYGLKFITIEKKETSSWLQVGPISSK